MSTVQGPSVSFPLSATTNGDATHAGDFGITSGSVGAGGGGAGTTTVHMRDVEGGGGGVVSTGGVVNGNGVNGVNGVHGRDEGGVGGAVKVEAEVDVKPGPSRRTTLLSTDEVVTERWKRAQFKKRTLEEAQITMQTAAKYVPDPFAA